MAVQITIDIFSGRPNPVLQISPAAAAGLFAATPAFLAAPAAQPSVAPFPRLGYRGLVIQHDEPALADTLPLASRLYGGVLHFANAAAATPNIERELVAPGGLGERS